MLLVVNPLLLHHSFEVDGHKGRCVMGAENLALALTAFPQLVLSLTTDLPDEVVEELISVHKFPSIAVSTPLPGYPGTWGKERAINLMLKRKSNPALNNWVAIDYDLSGYHPTSSKRILQCDFYNGFGLRTLNRLREFLINPPSPYQPPVDAEWSEGDLERANWTNLLARFNEVIETGGYPVSRQFENYLWERLIFECGNWWTEYHAETVVDVSRMPEPLKAGYENFVDQYPDNILYSPPEEEGPWTTMALLRRYFFGAVLGRPTQGRMNAVLRYGRDYGIHC